jgi:hypothetical protein
VPHQRPNRDDHGHVVGLVAVVVQVRGGLDEAVRLEVIELAAQAQFSEIAEVLE